MSDLSRLPKPARDKLRAMLMDVETEMTTGENGYARLIRAAQQEAEEIIMKAALAEAAKAAKAEEEAKRYHEVTVEANGKEYRYVTSITNTMRAEPVKKKKAVPKPEGWGDFA